MIYLILLLLGLGILVAVGTLITRHGKGGGEEETIQTAPASCSTCNGDDPQCEQLCMMKAATKEIEYYDDEELDRFKGRPSNDYTDDEAEQFREVLYTMRQDEVKGWNRSLVLRGIQLPDQVKDEVIMMMEN
jgi:hypothetical protein